MTPPVPSAPAATPAGLADALRRALTDGDGELRRLAGLQPANRADRFRTLLTVYDVHTAPLPALGPVARFQHHPVIAELKGRLEAAWLAELARPPVPADLAEDPVEAVRVIAARDRLPTAYRWLAKEAGWEEVIRFLALEGGPDAGFDDLVAVCQIGLHGAAKLELARNYWD